MLKKYWIFLNIALFLMVGIISVNVLWVQFFNLLSGVDPVEWKNVGFSSFGLLVSLYFLMRVIYQSDKAKGRIKKKIRIFE
ncbi:MAG: hypothetical protein M0Z31_07540 [Clostridia bacterium]|nr:hypothetical protein [Clostridia bacterium]